MSTNKYKELLTSNNQKQWLIFNPRLKKALSTGIVFGNDFKFSFINIDTNNSISIVSWIYPDISLGDGVISWSLDKNILNRGVGKKYKIIHIDNNKLVLLALDYSDIINLYSLKYVKQCDIPIFFVSTKNLDLF